MAAVCAQVHCPCGITSFLPGSQGFSSLAASGICPGLNIAISIDNCAPLYHVDIDNTGGIKENPMFGLSLKPLKLAYHSKCRT